MSSSKLTLEDILRQNLESAIIIELESALSITPEQAMRIYYHSQVANMVANGIYGTQYLSPKYLAEEILKQHPN